MSIIFSKAFMSFSKDLSVAESFLIGKNTLLIVEDAKTEYDLLTHADIEKLSCFYYEKEVLFSRFLPLEFKILNMIIIEIDMLLN